MREVNSCNPRLTQSSMNPSSSHSGEDWDEIDKNDGMVIDGVGEM
jgi:hypothetical protein